jgi:hypothetical protein
MRVVHTVQLCPEILVSVGPLGWPGIGTGQMKGDPDALVPLSCVPSDDGARCPLRLVSREVRDCHEAAKIARVTPVDSMSYQLQMARFCVLDGGWLPPYLFRRKSILEAKNDTGRQSMMMTMRMVRGGLA